MSCNQDPDHNSSWPNVMIPLFRDYQSSSVQSPSHVRLSATPWIAAHQASLSITNSQGSPKLMSIKSVMPSSHLILSHLLLLLPPIPPSIKVFSNESTLLIEYNKVSISEIKMSIVSPWVHSPVITPWDSPVCLKETVVMLKPTDQAEGKQMAKY